METLVLVHDGDRVVVREPVAPRMLRDVQPPARVVVTGFQGPPGAQGPKGDPAGTSTLQLPVGAVVQGLRLVRSAGGIAYPVDTSNEDHAAQVIGLGMQSVTTIGAEVSVQASGPVTDASWNWSDGLVWCGADGSPTQVPPTTGWLMVVGRVISPTTLHLLLEQPIYRG